MAASLGSLVVSLGLDAREYIAGLTRAEQQARRFAEATERSTRAATRDLGGRAARDASREIDNATRAARRYDSAIRTIAAAGAAGFGISAIAQAADAWQNMQARLNIVTRSSEATARVQEQLFQIAQNTRQPLKEVGDLYFRMAQATEAFGIDQSRVLRITDTLNKALIASGSSGKTAVSAIIQFTQGLAANRFSGQEFNSVNEQANRIIRALADGLQISVGELRRFATEGGLTTETIFRALETQIGKINKEFDLIPDTIEGSIQRVSNAFTKFIGTTAQTTGAIGAVAGAVTFLAKNIDVLAAVGFGAAVGLVGKAFIGLAGAIRGSVTAAIEAAAAHRANTVVIASQAVVEADLAKAKAVTTVATVKQNQVILAGLAATRQQIIAAREAAVAELAQVAAFEASTGAKVKSATASLALANANRALVGLNTAVVTTTQALTLARAADAVAQANQVAKATAAAGALAAVGGAAATTGRALLALVGGPLGAVLTALTVGATLWALFGRASEDAAKDTKQSTADILADLERANQALRDRLALQKGFAASAIGTPAEGRAAEIIRERDLLKATLAGGDTGDLGAKALADEIERLLALRQKMASDIQAVGFAAARGLKVPDIDVSVAVQRIGAVDAAIENMRAQLKAGATLNFGDDEARRRIQALDDELNLLLSRIREGAELRLDIETKDFKKNFDKFMLDHETKQEEFSRRQKEVQAELGPFFNRDVEARLRLKVFGKGEGNKAQRDAEAAIRALVDGRLRELQDGIREERDLLRERESILTEAQRDELISFEQHFEGRRALIESSAAVEIAKLQEMRAALVAEQNKFRKESDRIKFGTKIADIDRDIVAAERERDQAMSATNRDQGRALRAFEQDLLGLSIALAQLEDDYSLAGATAVRSFELQHREQRVQIALMKESKDEATRLNAELGEKMLNRMRDLTGAWAEMGAAQRQVGLITQGLSNDVARIGILRKKGLIGEIEELQRVSDANRERIGLLREQEAAILRIQDLQNNPEALAILDATRLKIEELNAELDLAGDHFRDLLGGEFSNAFSDFISGTKSAKEAFNDFVKSVQKQLSDIASRNIADALFKGEGPLAGIGGFLGDIFGGRNKRQGAAGGLGGVAGAGGQAAAATGLTSVATAATAAAAPVNLLATSSAAAASSAQTFGLSLGTAITAVDLPLTTLASSATSAATALQGLSTKGVADIDLTRPILKNAGGTFSTEETIDFEHEGRTVLIPTIVDGIRRTNDEAIRLWEQGINQAVGIFSSAAEAKAAAVLRSATIGEIRLPEALPASVDNLSAPLATLTTGVNSAAAALPPFATGALDAAAPLGSLGDSAGLAARLLREIEFPPLTIPPVDTSALVSGFQDASSGIAALFGPVDEASASLGEMTASAAANLASMASQEVAGAAAAASLTTVATSAAATTPPLTLLASNAAAAAAALATISSTRGGGLFGDLFGGGDFFGDSGTWGMFTRALGGPTFTGRPHLVGENGPEMFVPRVAGSIASNDELKKMASARPISIVQNINVPANMSRQSATQYATEIGLKTQRALARNT